jgi:hypothetical protein
MEARHGWWLEDRRKEPIMRHDRWFLALGIGMGMMAAEAARAMQIEPPKVEPPQVALAQNEVIPGTTTRPRSQGSPMAPRGGDADLRITEPDRAGMRGAYRTPRHDQAGNGPGRATSIQRELPMPKGVPSIIAP